ncbi:glycosyltransferase [Vibrio cyclitrophicus]|uniref:glycosyltransferase n=1 Tax=Vibrio cyclitrophicus TaxID=47951 RepID=UPI000C863087|nr:glycosyltransferase [Vibrio cyclitrophicus]PMF61423.1 hypothetical protein BCV09_16300 [Vibrio cyclitrophicus]PMH18891.1 hypothetical protein BCU73_21470 [Vibrio cyclitrophicus]
MIYLIVLDITKNAGIEKATLNLKDNLIGFYGKDNIKVISIRENISGSFIDDLKFLRKFCASLKAGDTIVSMYDRISIIISLILKYGSSKEKPEKLIAFQHADFYAHSFKIRLLRKFSYRYVDRLVTLTKKDASLYSTTTPVTTIPNSIPDISIAHTAWVERTNDFIAVGRLVEVKQFHHFINLSKIMNSQFSHKLSFNLYGSGPEKQKLESLIVSQGQDVSSILKGEVCNIFPPMQNSKFLIVTSQRESFSMVIIEAMLCGCVVISFDCETGPREIITNNYDGFLVKPNDIKAIKDISELLISNPIKALEISENAKRTAEKYKNSNVIKKWVEIL